MMGQWNMLRGLRATTHAGFHLLLPPCVHGRALPLAAPQLPGAPGLSTQQLLLASVPGGAWALAGAEPGMYALWRLRAGHGAGIPAPSWQCHSVFSGTLVGEPLTHR